MELIEQVSAGLIGLGAVAGLATIGVWQVIHAQPFSEPASLTALAMAVIAYYYNRASSRATQTAATRAAEQIQRANNGPEKSQ